MADIQTGSEKKSAGQVTWVRESLSALDLSDVYRMILLVSELLPARGARVSSGQGVTNALTAEEVAALSRDHEPTALHDLGKIEGELSTWAGSFIQHGQLK